MSAAPFTLADEALAVAAQHARQRDAAMAQRDAAEAQRDEARAERDALASLLADCRADRDGYVVERDAAEAQVAPLTSALREIAGMTFEPWTNGVKAGDIAMNATRAVDDTEDQVEPEPAEASIGCPHCVGGDAQLLGPLGRVAHYRCRSCGGQSFVTLF